MVSLRPLPLGNETQGLIPSPITKILDILAPDQRIMQGIRTKQDVLSSKRPVERILDMHDIKATNVPLTMCDNTGTTHVTTTSDHDNISSVKWNKIDDLVLFNIKLDSVIDTDQGIRITNCSAIVSDDVRDTAVTDSNLANLKEFVAGFLRCNAVDSETTLDIVKETEVFPRLLDGNDIYGKNQNQSGTGTVYCISKKC